LPTLKSLHVLSKDYTIYDHFLKVKPRNAAEVKFAQAVAYPNGSIFFNEGVFGHDEHYCKQNIYHELAHHLDYQTIITRTGPRHVIDGFREVAGWEKQTNGHFKPNPKEACFISSYAKENQMEHFAETVAAFYLNPMRLYRACPKLYHFVTTTVNAGVDPLLQSIDAKLTSGIWDCQSPKVKSLSVSKYGVQSFDSTGGDSEWISSNYDYECLAQRQMGAAANQCPEVALDQIKLAKSSLVESLTHILKTDSSSFTSESLMSKCLQKKLLTAQCMKDQVVHELRERLSADDFYRNFKDTPWLDQQLQSIGEKFQLNLKEYELSGFLDQHISGVVGACLKNLNLKSRIRISSKDCKPSVIKEFQLKGIDDDVFQSLIESTESEKFINRLNKFSGDFKAGIEKCRGNTICRQTHITNALSSQFPGTKLDIKEFERILHKIK
jgi:hypothetical protein